MPFSASLHRMKDTPRLPFVLAGAELRLACFCHALLNQIASLRTPTQLQYTAIEFEIDRNIWKQFSN